MEKWAQRAEGIWTGRPARVSGFNSPVTGWIRRAWTCPPISYALCLFLFLCIPSPSLSGWCRFNSDQLSNAFLATGTLHSLSWKNRAPSEPPTCSVPVFSVWDLRLAQELTHPSDATLPSAPINGPFFAPLYVVLAITCLMVTITMM